MKDEPAIVAAAGWHGIGTLSPDARIAAVVFVTILVLLGLGLAGRHSDSANGSPDTRT